MAERVRISISPTRSPGSERAGTFLTSHLAGGRPHLSGQLRLSPGRAERRPWWATAVGPLRVNVGSTSLLQPRSGSRVPRSQQRGHKARLWSTGICQAARRGPLFAFYSEDSGGLSSLLDRLIRKTLPAGQRRTKSQHLAATQSAGPTSSPGRERRVGRAGGCR